MDVLEGEGLASRMITQKTRERGELARAEREQIYLFGGRVEAPFFAASRTDDVNSPLLNF